jgi:hypothetical protein
MICCDCVFDLKRRCTGNFGNIRGATCFVCRGRFAKYESAAPLARLLHAVSWTNEDGTEGAALLCGLCIGLMESDDELQKRFWGHKALPPRASQNE